jgi:uncharacterized protein (UPF0248 family)
MLPIQDLLHRIRWDPEYGKGRFEIAYLDKLADRLERVPFEAVRFEPGERFGFEVMGLHGEAHFIPFHRVREVYRDGALIWQRPAPTD